VARGVRELHFYTMNRAALTFAICQLLGLTPAAREKAAA
jgi:methylenetetrahydrofolate reductase (NADPH)